MWFPTTPTDTLYSTGTRQYVFQKAMRIYGEGVVRPSKEGGRVVSWQKD